MRRWFAAIIAVALLLLAFALADRAVGATAEQLADDTRIWMEDVLGVDLPDRPVVSERITYCRCAGLAYPDVIVINAREWRELRHVARTGEDWWGYGRFLLHENAHDWRALDVPRSLEEGIVEALTLDLYPAWAAAMGLDVGWRADLAVYIPEVRAVRQASARVTGRPWRSRAARLWRRDLWRADSAGRLTMWEAAWA